MREPTIVVTDTPDPADVAAIGGGLGALLFTQNQCGTPMPGGGRPPYHPERSEGSFCSSKDSSLRSG